VLGVVDNLPGELPLTELERNECATGPARLGRQPDGATTESQQWPTAGVVNALIDALWLKIRDLSEGVDVDGRGDGRRRCALRSRRARSCSPGRRGSEPGHVQTGWWGSRKPACRPPRMGGRGVSVRDA